MVKGLGEGGRGLLLHPLLTPTAPWEAIRAIRAFCDGVSFEDCQSNKCPLHAWCDQLEHSEDPTDWDIPEEDPQT